MELQNKKVLITGGTSGLGLELVKILLSKGSIVYTYTNNKESIDVVKNEIQNNNFHIESADVSNIDEVKNYFSKFEDLDVIINNAGIWLEGLVEENDLEQINKVINVNLTGLIYNTSLALPFLKKKEISYIVNIVSTSGLESKPSQSVYAASKWGVHGFTECLKTDLKRTGVRVVGIYPGGMKTKLFRNFKYERGIDKFMNPEEVAKVVVSTMETSEDMVIDKVEIKRTKY